MISTAAWLRRVVCSPEQSLWLSTLDNDVRSLQISFAAYRTAALRILKIGDAGNESANARALHHAREFVGAMRRVGRLFETVNVAIFPPEVASVVKLEKKTKKAFFAQFTPVRDVSEHFAEKAKIPAQFLIPGLKVVHATKGTLHPIIGGLALNASYLEVSNFASAPVTQTALRTAVEARNRVITVVKKHFPKRTSEMFGMFPLDVSGFDK